MEMSKPTIERVVQATLAEQRKSRIERRWRTVGRVAARWTFYVALYYACEWLLMILVGNIRADWIPALPTLSWSATLRVFTPFLVFCFFMTVLVGPDDRKR